MDELYRSDILMALGKAITDSFWQMSFLWLAYRVLVAIPFQRKPEVRHAAASLLTVAGTVWFFFGFFRSLLSASLPVNTVPESAVAPDPGIIQHLLLALPYLSMAYLMVLLVLLARFGYQWMMIRSLRVDLLPARELQQLVDRLAIRMSIDREILIHFSCHVSVPSTIGVLKPVILLPLATMNNLSPEQMEAVIIHEMAHIRRFDYLINLIVSICSTVMFFNPFVHLLATSVRRDCEMSCDDEVIRFRQDPQQYAHALLLLEKSRSKPSFLMAATGTPGLLVGRVKRILNLPEEKVKYRHKLLVLVLLAGVMMGIGHLLSHRPQIVVSEPAGVNTQTVIARNITTLTTRPEAPSIRKFKTKKQAPVQPAAPALAPGPQVNSLGDPPAPAMPPVPPKPGREMREFFLIAEAPLVEAGAFPAPGQAPDVRDKRHTGILYTRDVVALREVPQAARELLQMEKLRQLQHQADVFKSFGDREFNQEFFFFNEDSKLAEKEIRQKLERAGMTITIINDEERIEIRVSDQAKKERR